MERGSPFRSPHSLIACFFYNRRIRALAFYANSEGQERGGSKHAITHDLLGVQINNLYRYQFKHGSPITVTLAREITQEELSKQAGPIPVSLTKEASQPRQARTS